MTLQTSELAIANKCRRIANEQGGRYIKEQIDSDIWTPKRLSNDWFLSLEFWFTKSFFRGRRDDISENFMNKAISTIKQFGKNKLFYTPDQEIESALIKAGVNNHIDRKMVIQSINFIKQINNHNIVTYCLKEIKLNQTIKVFNELKTIYGIGPKLACFFLRDLCFVYKVEPSSKEELICIQPVDTWVRKVAIKLGIPGCTEDKHETEVIEPIVSFCLKHKISPLMFNCGAWRTGARSFELLLESL
jgi:hypothetical protein